MGRTIRKTPDRWNQYRPIDRPIDGVRFVAFKTPLRSSLCKNMNKSDQFTLNHLMNRVAKMDKTLGLVVDLTNTDRYYDRNDLQGLGVQYRKIYCPGHEVHDREDIVREFIQIVHSFLAKDIEENVLIGVHCTHGINRTGYLICRYLIDICDWSADNAMRAFEKGRGYPIERGEYVSALHRAEAHKKTTSADSKRKDQSDKTRSRKKRKREKQQRSVMTNNDMDKMWQMMVGVVGHTLSDICDDAENSKKVVEEKIKEQDEDDNGQDDGENERDEDDDGEQEYPVIVGDEEEEGDKTRAQKRRRRRKKLQEMHAKLKRGKFWEIREMQKEKYGF